MLITRHMLFVGFSLNDDNFHRIANAVRRAVRTPGSSPTSPFGIALTLLQRPLVEELWKTDLRWVGMAGKAFELPTKIEEKRFGELQAARRLEIFLDYLLAQTRDTAHLLDDRYQGVLNDEERTLRDAVLSFKASLPAKVWSSQTCAPFRRLLGELGLGGQDGK